MFRPKRKLSQTPLWAVVSGGGGFSITNTDTRTDTVGGSNITYNSGGNPSIGASNANRVIVIVILARTNVSPGVNSVTVNGNTATQITSAASGSGTGMSVDMWSITEAAAGTSGLTTAAVVVNYIGTSVQSEIGVYRLITTTPTPSTATTSSNLSATTLGATITVPASGAAICGTTLRNAGAITWSGVSSTADFDTNYGNEGSGTHTTTTGSVTFTATTVAAAGEIRLTAAAWSP